MKRLYFVLFVCLVSAVSTVVEGIFLVELRTLCRRVRVSLVSKVNRFSSDKAVVSFTVPSISPSVITQDPLM